MASKVDSTMKKADLLKVAGDMNVPVTSSMTKEAIIAAIQAAEAASVRKGAGKKGEAAPKPAASKKTAAPAPAPQAKAKPAKPAAAKKEAIPAKAAPQSLKAAKPKAEPVAKERKLLPSIAASKKTPESVKAQEAKKPAAKPALSPEKPKAPEVKAQPPLPKAEPKSAPKAAPAAAPKAAPAMAKVSAEAKPKEAVKSAPAVKSAAVQPAQLEKTAAFFKAKWEIKPDVKKFFHPSEKEDYDFGKGASSLPQRYGETFISAMPKGPGAVYVYWEATPERAEEAREALGKHWSLVRWIVRIYDVTENEAGMTESDLFYDLAVDSSSGSGHAELPRVERAYIVTIGLVDNEGRYYPVAYSGRVTTPAPEAAEISPEGDSRLAELAVSPIPGSPSFGAVMIGQPGWAQGGWFSGAGISASGAGLISGAGMIAGGVGEGITGRWLWVNAELTVYGGASAGSVVFLGSTEIPQGQEGFFTAKYALPDGVMEIPVRALARDGGRMETDLTVTRATKVIR